MKKEDLLLFAKLWQDVNIDQLMDLFTEDAIYKPSLGFKGKKHYEGREEISQAVKMIQEHDDSLHSEIKNIYIDGNFGFWEWEYTDRQGRKTEGCDVFKFKENKILEKNAFRKVN